MKRYLEYIKENQSMEDQWFYSIHCNYIEDVEDFINKGIDINVQDNYGYTALMISSFGKYNYIVEILLKHPDIDVTIKNDEGYNFIDMLEDTSFLINYQIQKYLLKSGRDDIILFFDKYNLIDPKIKEEYPDLFNADKWGLI